MNWATQDGASWSHSIVPEWVPGKSVTFAQVACCPKCGRTDVLYYGKLKANEAVSCYECSGCHERWKTPARKIARATVIA